METSIYDFTAKTIQGKEISLSKYKGKWLIIVNTASQCGLTPQLKGLEELYQKYKNQELVILGFPCNQFGNQEPGDAKSIQEGCMLNYGVSFPMFDKVKVNGPSSHPIFKFLKKEQGGFLTNDIKWNFTKFIVNPQGKPIKRFAPTSKPEKLDAYLERKISPILKK